jgi:GT2 family glycosyltransferase
MIPVLICPVLSRSDMARRMLASLDVEVDRIVIVDNTPGHDLDIGPYEYIRPILPLGYSGGVNAGISQTPGAPWWFITSNDLVFAPGDLAAIVERIEAAEGPAVVTGSTRDSRLLRWAYAAVNRATVETVGLMDEWDFYPIYFDDVDMQRRCQLGGVEWIEYDGGILHGEAGWEGSTTIKSSEAHRNANSVTWQVNYERYCAKWGGPPGGETFATPYGLPVPLSFVRPDPAGRARRIW